MRLISQPPLPKTVLASPDAEPTVTTSSARPSTSPPPHDTPPAQAANLLFTLLARAAVFDRAAGVLTLEGTHPVATVLSQAPVPHAARLPAARLANASAWTSAGAWLAGPHAVLEGTPVGGGRSVSVVVRLASPAVASTSPLTLRFAARLASPDGAGALPGGVVAYALAGAAAEAAGADGGSARPPPPASLPGPPPPGTAPPLRLSDAALFIDAFVAGVEGSGQGGAKQVSPYYG
jgi:hypothetical protein